MNKLLSLAFLASVSCAPLAAQTEGTWLVRGGLTTVAPKDSSSNVMVGGADLGLGAGVNTNTQLGLNVAYFIENGLSVELLAATPFSHTISLNTVGELATVHHLPPSLTLNYYLNEEGSQWHPYIGAGINYTKFFDESFTDANQQAGFSDLSLDDSFGMTLQAGFDVQVNNQWHINASVRWVDIDTEATFELAGQPGQVAVDIDPYVFSIMVGYSF